MSASLTLSEKLDWLEEMGRVAEHLWRQRRVTATAPDVDDEIADDVRAIRASIGPPRDPWAT